jgi:hypothetical protein
MEKFLIMKTWLDDAREVCNEEQFDMLTGWISRYAFYKDEFDFDAIEDSTVRALFVGIRRQMDNMQASYLDKVEGGRKCGRKSAFDAEENEVIRQLASQGLKVKAIAAKMGIDDPLKIKAIYNAEGWKNRTRT